MRKRQPASVLPGRVPSASRTVRDQTSTTHGTRAHLLLRHLSAAAQINYSPYRMPYACTFGEPALETAAAAPPGAVVITSCGAAHRRRDVPTLAEERDQTRQGKADAAAPGGAAAAEEARAGAKALEAAAKAAGFQVIKSRFSSSTCGGCGEVICSGEAIAKPESDAKRGGWRHLACCDFEAAAKRKADAEGGGAAATAGRAGGGTGRKRARR